MPDINPDPIDLDTLTDDEVMKLGPDEIQTIQDQENVQVDEVDDENETVVDEPADADTSESKDEDALDDVTKGAEEEESESDPDDTETETEDESSEDGPKDNNETKTEEPTTPHNAEKPKKDDKDAPTLDETTQTAVDFFTKVSAPFKADGKQTSVRSPEDAIRLMQMGVNYSRRMEEIKPLREMDSMLRQHGLNSVDKINELINIYKGNPASIQKLLKEKNIDPLDIDVSKDASNQANNYRINPKDQNFQDAIDDVLSQEGGQDLIRDVNSHWDESSKEALREQPEIFENMLAQRSSGVYAKVKAELDYQRSVGYLKNMPFLQAYTQVANAMEDQGVFGSANKDQSGGNVPKAQIPIDTGIRKAAPKKKSKQPNPNLSSNNVTRSAPVQNGQDQNEQDFTSMSDADFLKLAPPG